MYKQNAARDTFLVERFLFTITLANGTISTVWQPHLPKHLSKPELAQYRAGRERFIRRIAPGQDVLVVEI
jgi:hypothetical protein